MDNIEQMKVCNHDDRKHKAKFVCHFCYMANGNQRKATLCKHTNRTHQARGLCKSCYQKVLYKFLTVPDAGTAQIK